MRHARAAALDALDDLITALRGIDGLKEKGRGVFYRKSRAFLHFHEDGERLFADIRSGDDFDRFDVTASAARAHVLAEVRRRVTTKD